jgi:microcystin degradation protein MlrC
MNYRFAYQGIAACALVVDTPGPTSPHVRNLSYRRIQRPVFPFDDAALPPNMILLAGPEAHTRA